jgi:hypothetical protein
MKLSYRYCPNDFHLLPTLSYCLFKHAWTSIFALLFLCQFFNALSAVLSKPLLSSLSPYFQAGSALKYGSDDLKRDESIVLRAVSNDGAALRYASEHLREAKCRRGHALASFQAPWEGWYCSECAQHLSPTQRIDKFKVYAQKEK